MSQRFAARRGAFTLYVAGLLSVNWTAPASAADVGASYEAGTAFGTQRQGNDSTVTGFDPGKIPNYNPNPSQTGLFSSASLFQPGADKINACAGYTPGSDKVENQECEAVNFLAKNPSQRIHVGIPAGDPVRSANLESATSPKDVLKRFGMDLDANPGECKDVTQTTDPVYRNETCYEGTSVVQPVCSIGRSVQADVDANYNCDQTYQAIESFTCRKGVMPKVSLQRSCIDGLTYTASGIRDGYVAVDEVTLDYICNSSQEAGPLPIKTYAHGMQGGCIGPQVFYVNFTNTTGWVDAPGLSPHWQGYCQPMKTQYRVTKACSASQPNCEIQLHWWQETCSSVPRCPYGELLWGEYGYFCHSGETSYAAIFETVCSTYRSAVLTLAFQHPSIYALSYEAANSCSMLEARS